jgi:2,3-dihydroxy-2,3-dihydrophenylpropionate dehydrogenase
MGDSLAGHRALVTGGGSGIGLAVARAYAAEQAEVTVLDRAPAPGMPAGARLVTGDTADPADMARAVARAAGPDGRLDLLTTCAGIFDFYARVTDLTAPELIASFAEIFKVNVLGTLLAVREAATALRKARGVVTLTQSTSAY